MSCEPIAVLFPPVRPYTYKCSSRDKLSASIVNALASPIHLAD